MIISTFMSNIPKWKEFKYVFEKLSPTTYRATHKETGESSVITDDPSTLSEEMFEQLKLFKSTPEQGLGERIPNATIDESDESLIYQYEILMAGAIRARLIASKRDPDTANVARLLDWLESTDFFVAPASSQYHECHVRGLLQHTLKVYNKMCDMWNVPDFSEVSIHSAALVALVHDWCKIGLYEQYMRNVKDEATGTWHQEPSYRRTTQNAVGSFGHGVSSMFLAGRFFSLTNDEALAIRWHMGEYNVSSPEMNELHHSNETYPLVQMIQFADRLAITKYYK